MVFLSSNNPLNCSRVTLNQKSLDQLVIYNMELKSKYLMLSNGLKHIFVKFINGKFSIINSIPNYKDL